MQDVKEDASGWRIYIKDQVPLNRSDLEAGEALGIGEELAEIQKGKDAKKIVTKLRSNDPDIDLKLRDFMCSEFFDIRTFGAVMTTFVKGALNCGQVRGPVQLGFARSIDPIVPQEVTITRTAITTESDAQNKTTEMGRKYVVPYGLYRAEGFVSANLARPRDRASPKKTFKCSGRPFSICLKTTTAPPAAKWPCASSSSSSTRPSLATPLPISCSMP